MRAPIGPHVIFGMDAAGVCTMNLGAAIEMMGGTQGDLVGQNLLEVYRDDPIALEALHRALAGECFTTEREFAGRLLWVYYQPLHDAEGRFTGSLGVTTDVTEHRANEVEVKAARLRSSVLVGLSADLTRDFMDPEALLQTTIRTVTEAIAESGSIWLSPEPGAPLRLRAVCHAGDPGAHADHGPSTTQRMPDERELSADHQPYGGRGRVGVRIPLRARGAVIGLIDLSRASGHEPFSDDETSLARDVAERFALAYDNAQLLQVQQRTTEARVRFQALADASHNLIAILDDAGEAVYVNATLRDSGLLLPEGETSESVWAGLSRVVGEQARDRIRRGLETVGRWSGDVDLAGTRGLVARADIFSLFHPDTGESLGSAWVGEDVSDLRDTEAALRSANADLSKFKALVEASTDFVAMAGLDGAVQYVNPSGRELVGMDPATDVTATTIEDYLTPGGIARSREVELPAVMGRGFWSGESTLRDHRGGAPIPVATASFLVRDSETGEPYAVATVQRDITERLRAESAQHELAEQRQALLTRLVEAQEEERAQIAADVHDDPVQAMAAVELRLGLLHRQVADHAPALVGPCSELQATVSGASSRLRALLFNLEPPDLDRGLAPALERSVEAMFADTGVTWTVECEREPDASTATRTIAYRIGKEALLNVRKHAAASHVVVSVGVRDGGVEVRVADDGRGFGPEPPCPTPGHRGLFDMQDRAAAAGGQWSLRERPEGGAAMTVWLPGR